MLRPRFAVLPSLLLLRSLFAQDCITDSPVDKTPNALIRKVVFQNAPLLSSQDQKQITSVVRDIEATGRVSAENIADEATEQVRRAYQDKGYFKVEAQGKAAQVPDDAVAGINIVVRVLNEGKQYRLRDLTILNAIAFPEAQLHALFPVQRGAIFRRDQIAKGLEELRRLYRSQGYINFVAVPHTEFDNAYETVDLQIDVQEGKQFRLRRVEVIGLAPETKARVLNDIDIFPGQVFDSSAWERSEAKLRAQGLYLSRDAIDNRLDEHNGLMDLVLDFRKSRPCHSLGNGASRPN